MDGPRMMIARDSIDPFAIPLDGLDVALGYGDGAISQWSSEGWARFKAPIVSLSIVTRPGDIGDIADVERFDFTPFDVPAFVHSFNRPARRAPTIYVDRTNLPIVVSVLSDAGLDPTGIDWFVATLDGTLTLYYGSPGVPIPTAIRVVAVQWKGSAQTGGNYDESVILDPSWVGGSMSVLNPSDPVEEMAHSWLTSAKNDTPPSLSLLDELSDLYYGNAPAFKAVMTAVAALNPASAANAQLVQDVADLKASVARIENALKSA